MILWNKLKGKITNFYEESNTILLKDIKQYRTKGNNIPCYMMETYIFTKMSSFPKLY